MEKIAILYQSSPAPLKDGVLKPMKPGGYSDSGADLAYCMKRIGLPILTPVDSPREHVDLDWVFPDDHEGIQAAIDLGAQIFWMNTVLFGNHPITAFSNMDLKVVGQPPMVVDTYDNKWITNNLLKNHGIPIPEARIIHENEAENYKSSFQFPVVLKPIQGRGSQGVIVVNNDAEFEKEVAFMFNSGKFGTKLYAEAYLPGKEITLTVMPPGQYRFNKSILTKENYWCLPPILRFNHIKGIAPYSGKVAIIKNSRVLLAHEINQLGIDKTILHCQNAAKLVAARAPVRIDCRANSKGNYYLFDLNLKPNMTGASRKHRKDQDSLTALAAQAIGWNYAQLVENILRQSWTF